MAYIAICNFCDFKLPWGDHIGTALMEDHLGKEHREYPADYKNPDGTSRVIKTYRSSPEG